MSKVSCSVYEQALCFSKCAMFETLFLLLAFPLVYQEQQRVSTHCC